LIFGGDGLDAGPFSHWNVGKLGLLKILPDPIEMFAKFVEEVLNPARQAVGEKCYIVYLGGNHEDWIRQAIEDDPKGKGYWEVENNLGGIPDEVIPYVNDSRFNLFNLGKLHFTHGTNYRKYEAQFVVTEYDVPIRFGHTHTYQAHTKKRGANVKDFRIAVNCGCLYDFSGGLPTYVKNRSVAWVNAIQYGVVEEGGSFFDDVPVIVNGKFMACGKIYAS
jgi:predicted phosphodiesterase